jgi:hypothetical protein
MPALQGHGGHHPPTHPTCWLPAPSTSGSCAAWSSIASSTLLMRSATLWWSVSTVPTCLLISKGMAGGVAGAQ